jgi:pre-mRNA cleavage complex 2 protein Pcf11
VSQEELGQILNQLRALTQNASPPPPPAPAPSQTFPPHAYPSQTQYAAHSSPPFAPSTAASTTYPQPSYQFGPPNHPSVETPALGPAFNPAANTSSQNPSIPTASAIDDLFNTLLQAGFVSASNMPVGADATTATTTTPAPASTAPTAVEGSKATNVDLLKESRRSYRKFILSQKIKLTTTDLTKYVVSFPSVKLFSSASRTQPDIVKLLYTQLPSKCKQCGIRFSNTSLGNKKLETHLDMHFRQNRKATQNIGRGHSRSWFIELEVRQFMFFLPYFSILNCCFLGLDKRQFRC